MGGRPITCLNLIAFPSKKLDAETLAQIIAGGLDKITESGAVLAGGHSIDDDEPKYGLSVNGVVHPDKVWANKGAQPGDVLILTKKIGSGVLFNANLKGWVSDETMELCLKTITTLNKTAAEVLSGFTVHAATDITGFGLAGHTLEIAQGSGVTIQLTPSTVPLFPQAAEMYERGVTTGMNGPNRGSVEPDTEFDSDMTEAQRELFIDPQTSGGLLACVPESEAAEAVVKLRQAGIADATIVGSVRSREAKSLIIRD